MVYVKLTTEDGVHNEYQYKEGLNCLDGEFNSDNICAPGGLYFCDEKDIGKWIKYGGKLMHYIWDNNKLCKLAVRQNGCALKCVKEQTEEICKLAVQQNVDALQFIKDSAIKYKLQNS